IPQTDVTPNNLTVSCTGSANKSASVCVGIDAGTGSGSTTADRTMSLAGSNVHYEIYITAGRTTVWGSTAGADEAQLAIVLDSSGNFTGSFPMYGRISAQASEPGGTYTSILNVTGTGHKGGASCNAGGTVATGNSFAAKVNLGVSCTISTSDINFGSVSSLTAAIPGSSSLSVNCTNGAAYTIAMNAGTTTGNTVAARKMSLNGAGAGVVGYQLYQSNSPLSIPWGDGTGGTFTEIGTGTGSTQTIPVYAQIPIQPTPTVGAYKDTVTATITY
ncbi:MAG: spore coat protein U domain-containing protein, partial [Lysobacteraceae bacterium]